MSDQKNYTTQIDYRPAIFQQIRDLSFSDIVPELIQNEIDAGSKKTVIDFNKTAMVCSGNGTPIDEEGWQRLRYFLGAGDEAPRKRNSIGVKNHGLKACFRLGDDIYLRSSGRYTHQTLYAKGAKNSPHPGALKHPIDDPSAPTNGVRIEVPYRTKALATDVGEPVRLEVANAERVEKLFKDTVREIQSRFIGAIRPGDRSTYTIEIKHYSLGTVRFDFAAGRQKKVGKDSWFCPSSEFFGELRRFRNGGSGSVSV